jgi:prephenate dehydrogenase
VAKIAFQEVAILGTGMIGSSLGLALKQLSPPPRIIGYDINSDSRRAANSAKAMDRVTGNIGEAVRAADLVIVSTPVRAIEIVFQEIAPLLRPDATVTDTASTKRQVLAWARQHLPPGTSFVGGHPMSGPNTAGTSGPSATIFNSAVYCVTPTPTADSKRVEQIVKMIEAIGSVAYYVDPDEHDGLVASISHLPYVLSATMMRVAATDRGWREARTIAAGGFAVATQLAEGDPRMWADICLTNPDQVGRQIDRMIESLEEVKEAMQHGDEGLYDRLLEAQNQRFEWLAGRGNDEPAPINTDDLKPANLLFGSRLGGLFGRGDRDKR